MNIYADRLVKACRDAERSWDTEDALRVPRPPASRTGTWLLLDVAPVSYVCANDIRTAGGVLAKDEEFLISQIVGGMAAAFRAIEEDVNPCAVMMFTEGRDGKMSRRRLYPAYKENRDKLRAGMDETERRIDQVRRQAISPANLTMAFGCSYGYCHTETLEADDAIAAVALGLSLSGCRCVIATNDSDIWQCCRWKGVEILDTARHSHVRQRDIEDAFGDARNIPLFKAIAGDPSDNIGGVPGIGEKTARLVLDGHSISPRHEALLREHEAAVIDGLMITHLPLVGSAGSCDHNMLAYELEPLPF